MKILITGGTSATAIKLSKALGDHQIVLADYGDVPLLKSTAYTLISLGEKNDDTLAHTLLNNCLDESVDAILPLRNFEIDAVAKSEVLFEEFNIKVLLPAQKILSAYFTNGVNTKAEEYLFFLNGEIIFATINYDFLALHGSGEGLSGAFYYSAEKLKFNYNLGMPMTAYIKSKDAFLFEFDDVLYPEKDYLLQVYYLFSEFLTYTELLDSAEILNFMRNEFEINGADHIFEKTANQFNIPLKYATNFGLLHQTARLPLKLLLFKQMLTLLQDLVVERKQIFLIVAGDPQQQLNKIKQMEWHGLEGYLELYFATEFESDTACIQFIMQKHQLKAKKMIVVGTEKLDHKHLIPMEVQFFSATKLL